MEEPEEASAAVARRETTRRSSVSDSRAAVAVTVDAEHQAFADVETPVAVSAVAEEDHLVEEHLVALAKEHAGNPAEVLAVELLEEALVVPAEMGQEPIQTPV